MKPKKITWKENASGNSVAYCGSLKVGWITKSLSCKNIYTLSLFRDMFDNYSYFKTKALAEKQFNDLELAKKALEEAFQEIFDLITETNEQAV